MKSDKQKRLIWLSEPQFSLKFGLYGRDTELHNVNSHA
ncbi:hypothetical protein ECFRIK1996_3650 [Escherichia coli FRIK1996]|nr:hypothetical protein ECFRIK1996_3650 [Escherichia coli FRIK1996]